MSKLKGVICNLANNLKMKIVPRSKFAIKSTPTNQPTNQPTKPHQKLSKVSKFQCDLHQLNSIDSLKIKSCIVHSLISILSILL